jgi:hypothetical protein
MTRRWTSRAVGASGTSKPSRCATPSTTPARGRPPCGSASLTTTRCVTDPMERRSTSGPRRKTSRRSTSRSTRCAPSAHAPAVCRSAVTGSARAWVHTAPSTEREGFAAGADAGGLLLVVVAVAQRPARSAVAVNAFGAVPQAEPLAGTPRAYGHLSRRSRRRVSRNTRPLMCPGDRALSGTRAGCRRMPFLGHAPDREPASESRPVPHAAADSRDMFRAVSEQRPPRHVGHGPPAASQDP